jgi:hypothetical protein
MLTLSSCFISASANTTDHFKIPTEYKLATTIPTSLTSDFDPLCDVEVTFHLKAIRSLERTENQLNVEKKIDSISKPDFYVIVNINNVKFKSPVWKNTQFL